MNYKEQLKDPRWLEKRQEIINRDGWVCQDCVAQTEKMHVHHIRYISGRMAWEYDNSDLKLLCSDCHSTHHNLKKQINEVFTVGNLRLSVYLGIFKILSYMRLDELEQIAEMISTYYKFRIKGGFNGRK